MNVRLLAMNMAIADACEGNYRLFELCDEVLIPTPSGTFEGGAEIWLHPAKLYGAKSMAESFVEHYNKYMKEELGELQSLKNQELR